MREWLALTDETFTIPEEDPWHLPVVRPTTLIALWPEPNAPTSMEILAAIAGALEDDIEPTEEMDSDDPEVLWNFVIEPEGFPGPVILWCEPSRPVPEEFADDEAARACRWVIGLQAQLDRRDPLSSFIDHVRLLLAAVPEAPGLLDLEAFACYPRSAIESLFLDDENEPPAEILWTIHGVGLDADSNDAAVWLHTHGLWRCGKAELEILEVPNALAGTGGHVINALGAMLLEAQLPPPGEPIQIGFNAEITVQPWESIAKFVPAGTPGSMDDRADTEDNLHCGVRAVICATEPRGVLRKVWVCPTEVLQSIESGAAVLALTERETARQQNLAQATWPELAMAFARTRAHGWRFLVKAGFEEDGQSEGREHLWFEIEQVKGDRARGKLLNSPLSIPSMRAGEEFWIERDQVSDWRAGESKRWFGPGDQFELQDAVNHAGNSDGRDGATS